MSQTVGVIDGRGLCYSYIFDGHPVRALDDVSIQIQAGQMVAILGRNGCGKSTLVKHFNALLKLQQGTLIVQNMDAADESVIWKLRRHCGMVFQNPENQFVSSIVEEDIAFGLENYGVPRAEISQKVRHALSLVDMEGFEKRATHALSGGQKQRIALAGVLALEPDILLFDEVTAMLDPVGREEILGAIHRLHRREGKTTLMITHYVEEAVQADQVILMQDGRILAHGAPTEILTDVSLLAQAGLLPPLPVRLWHDLRAAGISLGECPITEQALVEALCCLK